MKKALPLLFFAVFLSGCIKDLSDDVTSQGIVQFEEEPYYENGDIYFAIGIEFQGSGKEISIPWEILDGSTVIKSGKGNTVNKDGIINIFWWTNTIQVDIDELALSGKTLEISLDPDHKFTMKSQTTEELVNLWKKAPVTIP